MSRDPLPFRCCSPGTEGCTRRVAHVVLLGERDAVFACAGHWPDLVAALWLDGYDLDPGSFVARGVRVCRAYDAAGN